MSIKTAHQVAVEIAENATAAVLVDGTAIQSRTTAYRIEVSDVYGNPRKKQIVGLAGGQSRMVMFSREESNGAAVAHAVAWLNSRAFAIAA